MSATLRLHPSYHILQTSKNLPPVTANHTPHVLGFAQNQPLLMSYRHALRGNTDNLAAIALAKAEASVAKNSPHRDEPSPSPISPKRPRMNNFLS